MNRSTLLCFAIGLAIPILPAPNAQAQVTFVGTELLGRPTDQSVTLNVLASTAIDGYVEFGTQKGGPYTSTSPANGSTSPASAAANDPLVVVIDGLTSNMQYFYKFVYRQSGTTAFTERAEHSFWTQRPPGSTFTFTVIGDSHINVGGLGDPTTYQAALQNVANDHPDFHVDLGDTFAMDNVLAQTDANTSYMAALPYFDTISHSAPIFLVLGNHEEEEAWHLIDADTGNNPATSKPVFGANARKRYYLNPDPNPAVDTHGFYTGNLDTNASGGGLDIIGDHLPEDYYAFQWGDALFVAIDPYWYTTTKPFVGNTGGGESEDVGSGDRWDWTLGQAQYNWLANVLANSTATYKFVFAHHGTGGTQDYIRGGANAAPYVEWGGFNDDGITNTFASHRPGWAMPVHQLLVQNHVTAFFHAHDHEFAYEKRDGVVYQELPMPSDRSDGTGFAQYKETDPYTIRVLPNSGHLRVTVSPANVKVEYVRAFLAGSGGSNDTVAFSYTMNPSAAPLPNITAIKFTPGTGGKATLAWTTDVQSDSRVAYGTSTGMISSAYSATLTTSHSLTLSGLTTGTTYYYQVASRDSASDFSTAPAAPASFVVTVPDTTPPTISAISATPNSAGATITWTTNEASSSSVSYGTTTSLGSTATGTGGATSHSVTISGLKAGTTYYYKVTSVDAAGNSATSPSGTPNSFKTTADTTPPVISAILAAPSSTGATITWSTDKASSSSVSYGLTTSLGTTATGTGSVTSHSVTIGGLKAGTIYYYKVTSVDTAGNSATAPSGTPNSFQTTPDVTPPTISAIAAAPSATGATITWTTNEASTSSVSYGTMTSLGSTATGTGGVTSHSVTISGLKSATTYYYNVTSVDAAGNSATSPSVTPNNFTTSAASTTVTAFPASAVIISGTLRSGTAASLRAVDNNFYQVNSTTSGTPTASAYGSFTGVPSTLSSLKITYSGKSSVAATTQTIAIWRWATNAWVQLNSITVGTTETLVNSLAVTGTLSNYVSSSGELRVRVQCTTPATSFYSSGDLLEITYVSP